MAFRWPTDPPGKAPAHSKPWQEHQADMAATQQHAAAVTQAKAPTGPPKGLPAQPAAAGGAPAAAAAPAGGSATAAATIVPDAQFLAEAAQRAFQRTTQLNALTQEGSDDKTNTTTAINRLLEGAVGDRQKINEGANKAGLFYSGQRLKQVGDYDKKLNESTGDATTLLGQRQSARDAQIAAINAGGPLDEATAMAAAGTRQTARDTAAADLGALAPQVGTSDAIAALLGGTGAPAFKTVATTKTDSKGRKGKLHVYPDGHTVWVPTA